MFVATGAELDVQHTRRGGGAAGGAAGVRGERHAGAGSQGEVTRVPPFFPISIAEEKDDD